MRSHHLPRPADHRGWREHTDSVAPTVLVLGGFLTAPPMYRRFVARLRARGAAGVVVSNVWTPHWIAAAGRGLATICGQANRALRDASILAAAVSDGAPVLIVGHSAGGIVARLLTAPEPVGGRRSEAPAARVGAIVTLGAPYVVATGAGVGGRIHRLAAAIAGDVVVAAAPQPRVAAVPLEPAVAPMGFVSVGSVAIRGEPDGTGQERVSYQLYRALLGRAATPGTPGDGLVPLRATQVPGARQISLENAVHGPGSWAPWYGTDPAMDVWWPAAVEAWREALGQRASLDARVRLEAAG